MAEKANGELTVTQLKQTKATSGSVVAPVPAQPIAAARTQVSATTPARTYASNGTLSAGTVKKVDPDQGKITISHGPLANLSMPAMTMVFDLADRAMIGKVKAGDSIEFTAEKVNGALTITQLESGKAVTTPDQRPGPQSATTLPRSPNVVGRNLDPVSGQAAKAHSMPTSRSGTPDAPTQTNTGVGAPPYQSPFSNYQMMQEIADAPGAVWRAANDEVARLGGHVGQLREKSASALDDTPAKPAVGMAVVPGGAPAVHDMTKLKKDK
ncbi:MAG: copper-binding protein [Herminiimonas sp.]|nr:copper-binding protein [Herminiimonas sp.]